MSGFTDKDNVKLLQNKIIKKSWVYKKGSFSIQATPQTFDKLVDRFINANFNARFVKEYINVPICLHCQSYGHREASCSSTSHKTIDCKKKSLTFTYVLLMQISNNFQTKIDGDNAIKFRKMILD